MTVNTTTITSGPFVGNGIADTFSYTFKVDDKDQLRVYETTDLGVQTLLVVDTDYTVAGIGNDGGGILTRVAGALPVDFEWFIRSNYKETQLTAFDSQGAFFPELHENAMDKLTFLIQQILDTNDRSIHISELETPVIETELAPVATRAGKNFGFNSAGELEYKSISVVSGDVNFTTKSIMENDAGAVVGTSIYVLSDRAGGVFDTITTGTTAGVDLPDTYSIIVSAVNPAISFKLRMLYEMVNVLKLGALNDGTDTLAALDVIKVTIANLGKTQYFPSGSYGISDRYEWADGGNTFAEVGAIWLLLGSTASGGALAGPPSASQTKEITINRIEVDCNNIAGENGGGFGHKIGMFIGVYIARNVLHDANPSKFGGKALQFEGAETTRVRVGPVDFKNCSIGIDLGALGSKQTVDIQIGHVSVRDVDIPVYTNDTSVSLPDDDYDKFDVTIQSIVGRNCGRLKWVGATALGGGIIVGDRGGKLSIPYIKIINDRGGFGSVAYNGIGALVRGTMTGLRLGIVELDADCTALFDWNFPIFQAPTTASVASYATCESVKHTGNLDFVIKTKTGGGTIGPCMLKGVSIDSTLASLAGIVDAEAAIYTNAFLELIDSAGNFVSTGISSLFDINALGNTFATAAGVDASATLRGPWTPTDASGAALSFVVATGTWVKQGDDMTVFGQVTYPTTADGTAAKIGGFPETTKNEASSRSGGSLNISTASIALQLFPEMNSKETAILDSAGAAATNANCSDAVFHFTIRYRVA